MRTTETSGAPSSRLVVTYAMNPAGRAKVAETIGSAAAVTFLEDLEDDERAAALSDASVVLARNTSNELKPGESALLGNAALLQYVTAGVDFIPLTHFPPSLPIAFNSGGYAEPMAEHALAMALAAAKRLFVEHENLRAGAFNQFTPNRLLAGRVAGILGYGGIGVSTARLCRALGMRVHAINRHGVGDEYVDWIGKPADLHELLAVSDVLVLSLSLTKASTGLLGASELSLMKEDAILVNLARGEIVDEDALYSFLQERPNFTACIDAWWVEPVRHGEFSMRHDFLSLPNVIASPHNSASTGDWYLVALERALENCKRVLAGQAPRHRVGDEEKLAS